MKRAGILEWVECLDRVVGLIEGEEDVGTKKDNVVPQRFISGCLDRIQNFEGGLRLAFLKVILPNVIFRMKSNRWPSYSPMMISGMK